MKWGFDGLVTTDWWTFGEHYRETKAGNDIKMAAGYPERIKEAYEKGFITEAEIRLSARRILNMILKIGANCALPQARPPPFPYA